MRKLKRTATTIRHWLGTGIVGAGIALAATLVSHAEQRADAVAPEMATGVTQKQIASSKTYMVSSANPLATRTGVDILARGGSAVDAMVAVQLVLGLVEPQSSGIGGGAFLLHWDNSDGRLTTIDGRETAPMAAGTGLFTGADGKPLKFFDAVIGGRSVGVPGLVALMAKAHEAHGKLPWAELFEPAIALAEAGFQVSPRLNALVAASAESLFRYQATRDYFLSEEGVPIFAGTRITNQEYADTLREIAAGGAEAFYKGGIARDIVAAVNNAEGNPGLLSLADMADYEAREREPVCITYHGNDVCSMGPPSSGALTIAQILKMAEPHGLASLGPSSPQSWRIIGDATRLAFADRGLYMADSDFVKLPSGLLDNEYLAQRSKLLAGSAPLLPEAVKPGEPPSDHTMFFGFDRSPEMPSTSHFSIVDAEGNVVSMTSSIENGFGSRLMVRGFLLNNQLTDFSFVGEQDGKPVANRVEPGKRPRSSMSPTIVLRDGKPVLAIGSPGGSNIIPYVAKTVIAWIDWEMDIQQAIELPHLSNRFGRYDLEAGTAAEGLAPALQAMGYEVSVRDLNSGLHGIEITAQGLRGGADPRREGVAAGD